MNSRSMQTCFDGFAPEPDVPIWQWCADNVDYSLVPNYEIPREYLGPFDPDFAPFWKEPVECLLDYETREIVILKPSRSICTEHCIINPIRYFCATGSHQIYYLGGQGDMVERFFEERIERGLRCCKPLANVQWRKAGTRLISDRWQLTASYPGSKSSDKQCGYELIFVDELSLCPPGQVQTLRKRMDSYRHTGKLVMISSPDTKQKKPSSEDAIFIEFHGLQEDGKQTADQREWHCHDPKTGKLFVFRKGDEDTTDGVKWDKKAKDENGNWNMQRVAETAHYVTPDGTVIVNAEKMKIVRGGEWKPTNLNATNTERKTYHLEGLDLPFISGDIGRYAVDFLTAAKRGQEAVRVFAYEVEARMFYGEKQKLEDDTILQRAGKYKRGQRVSQVAEYAPFYLGKQLWTFATVDVQKEFLVYAIREWVDGGDSGLVQWAEAQTWETIKEQAIKFACSKMFIDNSYEERRNEVFEQCLMGVMKGAVPCFGRDSLQAAYDLKTRDPFEGTAKQGHQKLFMCTFNPDQIKSILYREVINVGGHVWRVPDDIDGKYVRGMRAEECIDGAWKKKDRYNHPWDVEVLQLLAAMCFGVFRQVAVMETGAAAAMLKAEKPVEEKKAATVSKNLCNVCRKHDMKIDRGYWRCLCGNAKRVVVDDYEKPKDEQEDEDR